MRLIFGLAFLGLLFISLPACAGVIYDNVGAPVAGLDGLNISDTAIADDFTLTSSTSLTHFTFWAAGSSADSDLGNSIGWAIFNDSSGAVGSLVASGTDVIVQRIDTMLDSSFGTNILKVEGDFGGSILLASGTYWVSFRDGPWGSAYDGTSAAWMRSIGTEVGHTVLADANEQTPSFPVPFQDTNMHFQLSSVPEPTSLAIFGTICLLACGRRRKS